MMLVFPMEPFPSRPHWRHKRWLQPGHTTYTACPAVPSPAVTQTMPLQLNKAPPGDSSQFSPLPRAEKTGHLGQRHPTVWQPECLSWLSVFRWVLVTKNATAVLRSQCLWCLLVGWCCLQAFTVSRRSEHGHHRGQCNNGPHEQCPSKRTLLFDNRTSCFEALCWPGIARFQQKRRCCEESGA